MRALLIIDLQNDFVPGGALAVPRGDEIIPVINRLIPSFPLVVATQDWHPLHHSSFASSHLGKCPYDRIEGEYGEQILWPVHCVAHTKGAELVPSLDRKKISHFFFKGTHPKIDSYSAFFDQSRVQSTGLGSFLQTKGVTDLFLVGLATEYCILYSALDAIELGFSVTVITDACRPISLHPLDEERALAAIVAAGGHLTTSSQKNPKIDSF